MPIAKIVSIRSTGSFVWKQGPAAGQTAYGQFIELSDGVQGGANAKSEHPNYKVGDDVEYTVTGQDNRGQNKLKIKKTDSPYAPVGQIAPNATQSAQKVASTNATTTIHPATAGCAFNKAVEALLAAKDGGYSVAAMLDGTFLKDVFELASQSVRILYKLEHGPLAPKHGERSFEQVKEIAKAAGFTPPADEGDPY